MHTVRGDGVAGIKRRRHDLSGNGVRNMAIASGHGQLKEDLESYTWRRQNVDYAALIWEDLQYQIDNRQSKVRRREIMPYPRFTKAIIHYFMGQHKSISKRKGSPYHIVDNDSRLDRLKFVAYKTFISISTGLIPPKIGRGKGAQGTKADVIPKKATVASKKKKGQEEQIQLPLKEEINRFVSEAKAERFQHQSGGLSEGAGLGLEGSTDDVTFPFDEKDEKVEDIPWVSTDDDETEDDDEEDDTSIDIEKTDDERMDIDVEDQVKGVAEINIAKEEEEENEEKVEEQNADEEQKGE
ncbi:hypothetical protein Tco_0828880 [Tanacetum coccineum]